MQMSSAMDDALVRATTATTTSTQKMKSAMKQMWDERKRLKAAANESGSLDMMLRGQIDEVFLVLAHLGEAILPLGVFLKDYYLQTLGDVQAAISSCGNDLLLLAWSELDAELQYVCTAGMAFCACYAPIPVYRGFGACVLSDYDWACPDMAYLEEKAKKKAVWTVYGVKQRVDAQPTRSVFLAFDQAIQLLQVKPLAFLGKRPAISSFAEHHPRYGPKPKREVKDDLEILEDWVKQLVHRGHPGPPAHKMTSWGIPFATWTSPYSCSIMKTVRDCETIAYHQMDPGRLLHGFLCRGNATLDEDQILVLLPGSPPESILSWLEGLPGTTHKVIRWQNLDTVAFEAKLSKSMRKKIGKYPLPTQFAVRDPNSSTRSTTTGSTSSPSVLEVPNTVSPPPYSAGDNPMQPPTLELALPDAREMPATPVNQQVVSSGPSAVAVVPRHIPGLPGGIARMGVAVGLKSIHNLRRMPSGVPTAASESTTTAAAVTGDRPRTATSVVRELDSQPTAAELPSQSVLVEAPSSNRDFVAELPAEPNSKASSSIARKPLAPGKERTEQPSVVIENTPKAVEQSGGGDAEPPNAPEDTPEIKVTPASPPDGHAADVNDRPVEHPTETTSENTSQDTADGLAKINRGVAETEELSTAVEAMPTSTEAPSAAKLSESSEPAAMSTEDEYLDLLNKVAKGELTTEALKELLQARSLFRP